MAPSLGVDELLLQYVTCNTETEIEDKNAPANLHIHSSLVTLF